MSNQVVNRQVNIFIQSGKAQEALDTLIKKENLLKDALSKATDPAKVQKLKTELDRLQEPIDRARKKLSGELTPSLKDTRAAAAAVTNELSRMSAEDAGFKEKVQLFRQANKELEEQKGKVGVLSRAMKSFWQEAKTVAVGVIIGNTVQNMLQTVLGYVTGIVSGAAKVSDELSGIEKTTGLTAEQVKKINSELKKIDTRTSASDLRELAKEAGKLGKDSVEDVIKFVKQADQIKVALGEDLGADAINSIGKLSKIFKTEMLNIGSAINEIGAQSEASERFAVDFLNMVSGVGPALNISAGDLLGYGAALEIGGQQVEKSGTAINNFLIDFVREADKFGKAAGFADGELKKLIDSRGVNEAFLQFLTRLKQANPETDKFLQKMQDIGVDGSRGANALLVLANNIEGVRTQQKIGNEALREGTSLTKEFDKVNNNAGAALDKFKKNFASLFQSRSFQEAGEAAIRVMNGFVNVIKSIPAFIEENRFALLTLAAGIALLNKEYIVSAALSIKDTAAKIINSAVTKGMAAINTIVAASTALYSAVVLVLQGRISAATAAQVLWRTATAAGLGPLGVLLTVVGAVIIAVSTLASRTKTLTAAQELQADIAKKVAESTADTLEKLRQLTGVINDNNGSLDNRKKALNALIAIAPDYLQGLTLENLKTAEGKKLLDDYIASLRKKAEVEAKASVLSDTIKVRDNAIATLRSDGTGRFANKSDAEIEKFIRSGANRAKENKILGLGGDFKESGINFNEVARAFDKISILQKDVDAAAKQNVESILNQSASAAGATGAVASKAAKSINSLKEKLKGLQEARDAETDDAKRNGLNKQIATIENQLAKMEGTAQRVSGGAKKVANDLKSLQEELRQAAISLLPEGVFKELTQLEEKYDKLRERAAVNNKLLLQVEALYQIELQGIRDRYRKEYNDQQKKEATERIKLEKETIEKIKQLQLVRLPEQVVNLHKTLGSDAIIRDELAILKTSGKARLAARLQLLQDEEKQELDNATLTAEQRKLIEEKYRAKRKETQEDYWLAEADMILEFAGQALQIFDVLAKGKTDRENAELERDRKLNEKKKHNLEAQLKSGMVSQLEYDRKVRELEQGQEKREKEVRLRQFRRDQRMQVVQALMSGAQAVVSTLAARPGSLDVISLGAFRAINIGLAIAATAAQVASIAKQKPPAYGKGGVLSGPLHSDKTKGLPVTNPYTGQVQAYLEGGEGIGSRRTMQDTRRYNVSGTPSQIYSLLNGINGGVQWTSGAALRPAWSQQRPVQMNLPAISSSLYKTRGLFAGGGVFDAGKVAPPSQDTPGTSAELLQVLQQVGLALNNVSTTLRNIQQEGIDANVYLGTLQKQQERLDEIRSAASATIR